MVCRHTNVTPHLSCCNTARGLFVETAALPRWPPLCPASTSAHHSLRGMGKWRRRPGLSTQDRRWGRSALGCKRRHMLLLVLYRHSLYRGGSSTHLVLQTQPSSQTESSTGVSVTLPGAVQAGQTVQSACCSPDR